MYSPLLLPREGRERETSYLHLLALGFMTSVVTSQIYRQKRGLVASV